MIYPDFNFSQEQCLNQFVYHAYLDQAFPSCFFIKVIPDNFYIPKLNSLCDILNADDSAYQYTKWILFSIISRLSIELQNKNDVKHQNSVALPILKKPNISDSFYLLFLDSKMVKSKEATLLLQIFTGKNDFFLKKNTQTTDDQKSVIQAISYLFEKHRGLYTALVHHGYIEALLMRIGPEPLFNHFKLNSFSLREQFDKSYLPFFSVKLVNPSNFGQFWSQYPTLFDEKASQLFQSLFACDNPFPYVSTKYFPESDLNNPILSLTNDVLTKRNKSFVDIILIVCRTLIINGLKTAKDQEYLLTYTKQFPDLRIIAFLAEYESIKNEPVFENIVSEITKNMSSDPSSISQIDHESIMVDVMYRLSNDCSLCNFLSNNVGRKTKFSDLENKSLPKYLHVYANLRIDCSIYNDKKMFVVSDDDRMKDFTFIFTYQAMNLIINQIENLKRNESQVDIFEMSSISLSETSLEQSQSMTDLDSIFTNNLNKLIELIKSLTNEEFFEKVMIDLFSLLFITEKRKDDNEGFQLSLFSDDTITDIVSILFNFCPKQKEISKAFSRFKFIDILSQKKFDEAKNLAENEDGPLYRLALIAELISKVSNSQQWSFPSCIDKSLFDAEYLLSNNEDFGGEMKDDFAELHVLIGKRREFKKNKKYSPIYLYDIENTDKNIKVFEASEYNKIEKDANCIQFNDFADFESMLGKPDNSHIEDIDDILGVVIQSCKLAYLVTLKTVPEEYKDNKFINAIFERNANVANRSIGKDEINSLDDVVNYLKKSDEKLQGISDSEMEILFEKSFNSTPLPYDILNDLYIRNSDFVYSHYKTLIDKLKLNDFVQLMPFCFYNYFPSNSQLSNIDSNMSLIEYLEFLVKEKKYSQAKKLSSDFNLSIQLDSFVKNHFSKEDSQIIEITFPHLKDFVVKMNAKVKEAIYLPSKEENLIMDQLDDFMNFDEETICTDCYENRPTFSNLFSLFRTIRENIKIISTPLMKKVVEIVITLLSSSYIDSFEAELDAMTILPRLSNYMKLFKLKMQNLTDSSKHQTLILQLDCLSRLVSCGFNTVYKEVYTFKDFFSKDQGASYASLCQKYDQTDILRDIQTSWVLFEYRFFDSSLNCMKLGLVKRGNIELKEAVKAHQSLKIECQILANDLIPILSFIRPIFASTFIDEINKIFNELKEEDDNFIDKINYEEMIKEESGIDINHIQEDFFNFLRKEQNAKEGEIEVEEKTELPVFHIASPQIIALDESLAIIGAFEDRILFHCQFGDFDEAFNLFNQLTSKSGNFLNTQSSFTSSSPSSYSSSSLRLPLFLRVLVTPAIAFEQWNCFWLKLLRCQNHLENVIDDFINFLNQNQVLFILFDVQRRLELYDNSLLAAIKLFVTSDSWKKEKELLNNMSILIMKSLSLNAPDEKKKHKSLFTDDSLFQLQRRVNVQLAVIEMFIQMNVPFEKELELMTSKENTLNLASYLLLKMQIGYFFEICELPDISMDEACEYAIEKLNSSSNKEELNFGNFFKNLTRLEAGTYRKIIMCLSKSIYRRVPDEKTFVQFMRQNIKGDRIVVEVLQNFGFEKEANEILKRKSYK